MMAQAWLGTFYGQRRGLGHEKTGCGSFNGAPVFERTPNRIGFELDWWSFGRLHFLAEDNFVTPTRQRRHPFGGALLAHPGSPFSPDRSCVNRRGVLNAQMIEFGCRQGFARTRAEHVVVLSLGNIPQAVLSAHTVHQIAGEGSGQHFSGTPLGNAIADGICAEGGNQIIRIKPGRDRQRL